MSGTGRAAWSFALLALVASDVHPAPGQAREVHGEDSVFARPGVTIVWGVLRAAADAATQVVVRVAVTGPAYGYVSVDGVDPFSGARRPVLAAPVGAALDVRSPRSTFADFPRREIRLYATAEAWRAGQPALTVYYLGVPDTTPEFASETALQIYLAAAVARSRRLAGGGTP